MEARGLQVQRVCVCARGGLGWLQLQSVRDRGEAKSRPSRAVLTGAIETFDVDQHLLPRPIG